MADEENKDVPTEEGSPEEQAEEGEVVSPEGEAQATPSPAPEAVDPSEEQPTPDDHSAEQAEADNSPVVKAEGDSTPVQAEDELASAEASAEEGGEAEVGGDETSQSPAEAQDAVPEGDQQATEQDGDAQAAESSDQQEAAEGSTESAEPAANGEQQPQAEDGEASGTPKPTDGEPAEGDKPATEAPESEENPSADQEGQEQQEAAKEGSEQEGGEEATGDGQEQAEGGADGDAEEGAEGAEAAEKEGGQHQATIPEEDEPTEPKTPVPQSDTFADGERTESPVAVGEKLSREGTPEQMSGGDYEEQLGSPPVPGTPELDSDEEEEEEEEEDEEYEEEEPEFDREQLIERYHQCLAERQQFQEQNYQLQHKLAEYFRKKKSDDSRQEADKNVTDQEQRYLKYMANLDELRRQDGEERGIFKLQIEELKERCQDKQEKVDDERQKFMDFKRNSALAAINSRSGKNIPPKDIEQYLSTENRKEAEVVGVRLENIKLKNKLKKKEHALKSKEELAEGLHLIDFEQLKIENQTYNEKIEERNEELLKLRKKITNTVQVLTHLKEKLQYVQAENQVQQARLREVEELAARKRDILSRTKQARDALRIDNQKLRQNCGLLGNEPLLRDFEERKDESDDLKQKLENLKTTHAELTLNLNGVRRKIEQAKTGRM